MILHRALYREASTATTAIVVVLLIVLVFFGLTAILGRAARGDYAEQIVFALLGWQTLKRLDLLLPLGFYLGVLLTLSRWYRDNEMTVLAACGVGLLQLLRPVMVLAGAVALLTAIAAFYLTPLANRQLEVIKASSEQRPEFAGIAPGTFSESAGDGRILYAEAIAADGTLQRVFLSNLEERPRVVLARSGAPFTDPRTGERYVRLYDGWAYDGVPGQPDYQLMRFETYTARLESRPLSVPAKLEGLPSRVLFRDTTRVAIAEWHWRLSKPILVFVLAAFALVLAYTDARRGRLSNLFTAVLVYFIYSNLLGLGVTFLKKGQVPAALGLWWVHLLFAALAALWLARRAAHKPLWARPRRPATS